MHVPMDGPCNNGTHVQVDGPCIYGMHVSVSGPCINGMHVSQGHESMVRKFLWMSMYL